MAGELIQTFSHEDLYKDRNIKIYVSSIGRTQISWVLCINFMFVRAWSYDRQYAAFRQAQRNDDKNIKNKTKKVLGRY